MNLKQYIEIQPTPKLRENTYEQEIIKILRKIDKFCHGEKIRDFILFQKRNDWHFYAFFSGMSLLFLL